MTNEEKYRKALEMIVNSEEHEGDIFVCDFQTLQGVARQALDDKRSSEFSTPDCPDCACVQDGQCLCIPSKPAAGMELTNEEIARHLGYSDVSDILNGHTILPKDIIDNVRSAISAQQPAAVVELTDEEIIFAADAWNRRTRPQASAIVPEGLRQAVIDAIISTQGVSEGIAADAVISVLREFAASQRETKP